MKKYNFRIWSVSGSFWDYSFNVVRGKVSLVKVISGEKKQDKKVSPTMLFKYYVREIKR